MKLTLTQCFLRSLYKFGDAEKRWAKARRTGVTDEELHRMCCYEYGISGGVCCDGYQYSYAGGHNPRFWFDKMSAHGKPTLSGMTLVHQARRLLCIPYPKAKKEKRRP